MNACENVSVYVARVRLRNSFFKHFNESTRRRDTRLRGVGRVALRVSGHVQKTCTEISLVEVDDKSSCIFFVIRKKINFPQFFTERTTVNIVLYRTFINY